MNLLQKTTIIYVSIGALNILAVAILTPVKVAPVKKNSYYNTANPPISLSLSIIM